MNRFALLTLLFVYYLVWLLLPIFQLENTIVGFPLPSIYAVILPILLLLAGLFLVVSFLGMLVVSAKDSTEKAVKRKSVHAF
ncbi:LANO_0H09538g1_1 [Lachancea nothofagi CBS 11611]|uniref:Dolichol phosphate-mannose biosynthesis regulatory protein n=1 Tax=Lachancea nothofagi CBS 11611 TaxID=1266666 RepID=A0A1G4KM35_9SACH|nr:LANO_0H09538g1_1 [Lachancea nothofagi CBS 11611]